MHQAFPVAHIADEETNAFICKFLSHLKLLQLITGIDDDPLDLGVLKKTSDAAVPEGAGSAGNEYGGWFHGVGLKG